MSPRSPTPTLFPYTTLFRSRSRRMIETVAAYLADRRVPLVVDPVMVASSGAALLQDDAVEALVTLDRKSTRLNSSHPSISYAVFCLKKKKRRLQHRHCY